MKTIPQDYIEAIGCAILAVNSWPLDRVWDNIESLRKASLFSPSSISEMSLEEVITRLTKNGYDRGNLTWMFAERLQQAMTEIGLGKLDDLVAAVKAKDNDKAENILKKLPGIGPIAAKNALMLIGS